MYRVVSVVSPKLNDSGVEDAKYVLVRLSALFRNSAAFTSKSGNLRICPGHYLVANQCRHEQQHIQVEYVEFWFVYFEIGKPSYLSWARANHCSHEKEHAHGVGLMSRL